MVVTIIIEFHNNYWDKRSKDIHGNICIYSVVDLGTGMTFLHSFSDSACILSNLTRTSCSCTHS